MMSEDPNDSATVTGKNPSFRRLERLFEVTETFFGAIVLTIYRNCSRPKSLSEF